MQISMYVKNEIRILGWDDGPFKKGSKGTVPVIGTVFRGGSFLDGILRIDVEIDGFDATKKMIKAINKTRHKDLRVIMLDGITFGGFNMVDIKELHKKTGLPVIAITRKKVDMRKFREAMKKLPNFEKRWKVVESAGEFYTIKTGKRGKNIYFQKIGLTKEDAEKIIRLSARRSLLPEPLRVSHLIASGIVKGESIGRA
ncbi:MAG: DUF99 family protein [Candidatus Aenigmarchaeota archaeon]|nr:DUF99 family protein [Candidatus Aenigmarchaeota archaeon]